MAVTYPNGFEKCKLSSSWIASFVISLPAFFRLVQCLRRYSDDHRPHPYLTNSLKYVFSLITIYSSFAAKFSGSTGMQYFWIFSSVMTATYSYFWDIWYDFGLFQPNTVHKYLRKEIIFPPWVYYVGLV